jgi:hypothetical protein
VFFLQQINNGVLRLAVGYYYLFALTSLIVSWFITILDWKGFKKSVRFVRLEMHDAD